MAGGGGGGIPKGAGGDLRGMYPNPRVSMVTFPISNAMGFVPLLENAEPETTYALDDITEGKLLIFMRAQWSPAPGGNRIFVRFRRLGTFDANAYYNRIWSSAGTLDDNAVKGAIIARPGVLGDRIHSSYSVAIIGGASPCVFVHSSCHLFGPSDNSTMTPPIYVWSVLRQSAVSIDGIRFEVEPGTLSSFSASVYRMR